VARTKSNNNVDEWACVLNVTAIQSFFNNNNQMILEDSTAGSQKWLVGVLAENNTNSGMNNFGTTIEDLIQWTSSTDSNLGY